jgi:hypothetical protein
LDGSSLTIFEWAHTPEKSHHHFYNLFLNAQKTKIEFELRERVFLVCELWTKWYDSFARINTKNMRYYSPLVTNLKRGVTDRNLNKNDLRLIFMWSKISWKGSWGNEEEKNQLRFVSNSKKSIFKDQCESQAFLPHLFRNFGITKRIKFPFIIISIEK